MSADVSLELSAGHWRGCTLPFHFPPAKAPRENKNEIIDVKTLWKGLQKVLVGEETEAGLATYV